MIPHRRATSTTLDADTFRDFDTGSDLATNARGFRVRQKDILLPHP